MDVTGRVRLLDGTELSVVTGIDDHSRFCVSAMLMRRATARPVCAALAAAVRAHGVPDAVLTDNGKVFTGRFGVTKTEVLFDRICRENGVRHLLTAPYSATTTGKIERLHKTMRAEFFSVARAGTIDELQAALDRWVLHYNTERPHQGIGDVPPARRFALARLGPPEPVVAEDPAKGLAPPKPASMARPATRTVNRDGGIHLARHRYPVGRWRAGETVEVVCGDALVEVFHRGVLVVSHVARHQPGAKIVNQKPLSPVARKPRRRPGDTTPFVTRLVDSSGKLSFAGAEYKVGADHRRRSVQVAVVEGLVVIALDGRTIRTHRIRHDRTKENGALANRRAGPVSRSPRRDPPHV